MFTSVVWGDNQGYLQGWIVDLSLLLINLTVAAIIKGDLNCSVFMSHYVDYPLELEGKYTWLCDHNVTERRGGKEKREPESLVSAEFIERLSWIQTQVAASCIGETLYRER